MGGTWDCDQRRRRQRRRGHAGRGRPRPSTSATSPGHRGGEGRDHQGGRSQFSRNSRRGAEVLLRRAAEVGATVAREGGRVRRRRRAKSRSVDSCSRCRARCEVRGGCSSRCTARTRRTTRRAGAVEAFVGATVVTQERTRHRGGAARRSRDRRRPLDSRLFDVRRPCCSTRPTTRMARSDRGRAAGGLHLRAAGRSGRVMADKDVEGPFDAFEPVMETIVCTQNSTPRSMDAEVLAEVARGVLGMDRVEVRPRLDDAIERWPSGWPRQPGRRRVRRRWGARDRIGDHRGRGAHAGGGCRGVMWSDRWCSASCSSCSVWRRWS